MRFFMINNNYDNYVRFEDSPLHMALESMKGSDESVKAGYMEAKRLIKLGTPLNTLAYGHAEGRGTPLYMSLMYSQATKLTALLMRLGAEYKGNNFYTGKIDYLAEESELCSERHSRL